MPFYRIWSGYSDEGSGDRTEVEASAYFNSMDEAVEYVKTAYIDARYKDRVEDNVGDEEIAFVEVEVYFDLDGNEVKPDELPDDWQERGYGWRNEFFQIELIEPRVVKR